MLSLPFFCARVLPNKGRERFGNGCVEGVWHVVFVIYEEGSVPILVVRFGGLDVGRVVGGRYCIG